MGSPIGTAASLLASRAIFLRRPLPPLVTASGLVLAMFLLAGAAEGAPDPRCGGDPEFTFCPNLVAGPLTVSLADRRRALQVSDQVTNKGNRDAPPTSFQVTIAGRTFPSHQLASVPLNDPVQVETTVLVPADLRGGPKTVSLTVDPANGVGEFDEADNTAAADVFLPALPDLRVDTVRLTVTRGGTAIAVEALVKNAGGAASRRATTLAMSASGTTRTPLVPPLAAAQSQTVNAELPIPAAARAGSVTVSFEVDPSDLVAEADESNNQLSKGVTVAPDLVVGPPRVARRSADFVVLRAQVTNAGKADAGPTTAHASAPGWTPASAPVPELRVQARTTVRLRLHVPQAARGHAPTITVAVDPVPGDPPGNNRNSQPVSIPASVPDLALSAMRLTPRKDKLAVHAVVANVGEAPALHLRVELLRPPWARRLRRLPRLKAGASTPIDFLLRVPRWARGRQVAFRLRADPVPGERNLTNNARSSAVKLPRAHHGSAATIAGSIGGSLFVLTLGFGFLRGRRVRLRRVWQRQAEDERPEACEEDQAHVLRGKCEVKPGLRKIGHLELGTEHDRERKRLVGGLVDQLNKALWARRLRRRRRMRALVEPLGEQLIAEIEQWLGENSRREVAIRARITGGKLECEMTRAECVRDGDSCQWQERQHWKGEYEHEVDEPVSTIHLPLVPRPERVEDLNAELLALVGRVDIPRRARAPEVPASLPRG